MWCKAALAAAASAVDLTHGLLGYDWHGVLIAFLVGIVGGLGPTLYALGSREVLVADLPFVILRNSVLSIGSTIVVFSLCVANNSLAMDGATLWGYTFRPLARDVVGLLILLAAISSGRVLFFARDFATDLSLWVRRYVFRRDSPIPLDNPVAQELKP